MKLMWTFLSLAAIAVTTVAGNPPKTSSATFNLTNLDDNALLQVLDQISLEDLISLADTNHELCDFIERHYIIGKYRLSEKQFKMKITGYQYTLTIKFEPRLVIIIRYDVILRLFRLFGSHIRHLRMHRVSWEPKDFKFLRTAQHIQRFTRHTLEILSLKRQANVVLFYWTQPFVNIRNVELTVEQKPRSELPILFPNVRTLNITVEQSFSHGPLHLANLTHLNYKDYDKMSNKEILMDFLSSNQQLQSLNIIHKLIDVETMSYISVNLPRLNYLHFNGMMNVFVHRDVETLIRFPSVKHFSMSLIPGRGDERPLPLVFEQLEVLELSYVGLPSAIAEFIATNRHLRRLSLRDSGPLRTDLFALLDQLPELQELDFDWTSDVSVEYVERLLKRSRPLQRVMAVMTNERIRDDIERMQQAVSNGWNVSQLRLKNQSLLIFQRIE